MNKASRILVCVDLSQYSPATLEYAGRFINPDLERMTIVSVVNQREVSSVDLVHYYAVVPLDKGDYISSLKRDRIKAVQALVTEVLGKDPRIDIQVKVGVPFECILEVSDKGGYDMVIIANKGRGNVSRFLFGSVAEKVFRHSRIPVLSVRSGQIMSRPSEREANEA